MLGNGYVIDHCISVFRKEQEELAFRNYVADALKMISENSAKQVGGSYITVRYADVISTDNGIDEVDAEQEANDIINDFKNRLNVH